MKDNHWGNGNCKNSYKKDGNFRDARLFKLRGSFRYRPKTENKQKITIRNRNRGEEKEGIYNDHNAMND